MQEKKEGEQDRERTLRVDDRLRMRKNEQISEQHTGLGVMKRSLTEINYQDCTTTGDSV